VLARVPEKPYRIILLARQLLDATPPPPTRRVPAMPGSNCAAADKVKPAASPAADKPAEIAGNISYHAQYSPHFSPLAFGPEEAFYATAESVRDHLIEVSAREPDP